MNFTFCKQCGRQNPASSRFCTSCGSSLQEPNPNPSGNVITLLPGVQLRDRYIIQRLLGQGGFGSTYLAEDTGRFNERVALKELTPTLRGTEAVTKAEELFQREAATLYRLQHPQIPRFWEFFRQGKRLFLVQDFIDGQTYQSLLNQRLQQGQRFSEAEILQLLRQLLPVLSYLHRQGIIHRDISPDNIICRAQDRLPVLIDLGGVKQVAIDVASQIAGSHNPSGNVGTRLGKVGYAPDEQMRLGIVAPHSDLYALAVTALVLMTGKKPQQLLDPYTMNWIWNRELTLSPFLTGVLNRMLAKDPLQRFQSADEIIQVLEPKATVINNNYSQANRGSSGENKQKQRSTTRGKRLGNLILDSIFFLPFAFMVGLFLGITGLYHSLRVEEWNETLFGLIIIIIYYTLSESIWGKTIAKFITKTKVVTNDGTKPDFARILGRSLARCIPFEALSFLGSQNPRGWHDKLSGTMVVDDRTSP